MRPDPSFMRELKALDPKLDCHFDNKVERFIVSYMRPVGRPINIHQIKQDDGSFRQPSMQDIAILSEGDTHKTTVNERSKKFAKYCKDFENDHRKNTVQDFRDRTKDDKFQLIRKFASINGSGKKIMPFRQLDYKSKGKVFA